VPPDAGLQKRANFSTLIVGLAGVAGSGDKRSANHHDSIVFYLVMDRFDVH
jgi:hypothetical protein